MRTGCSLLDSLPPLSSWSRGLSDSFSLSLSVESSLISCWVRFVPRGCGGLSDTEDRGDGRVQDEGDEGRDTPALDSGESDDEPP
jgi:hypothetical protein